MNPFHNTLLFYPLALELYRRSSIDLIWPHQGISRVNAAKIYTMNPFHYISCATLLLFSFSRTFPTSSTLILLGPTRVNTAKIYTTIPFHNISCVTIILKKWLWRTAARPHEGNTGHYGRSGNHGGTHGGMTSRSDLLF